MNLQLKGFYISTGIHSIFFLFFVLLQLFVAKPDKIVVIDFNFFGDISSIRTMEEPSGANAPKQVAAFPHKRMADNPKPKEAPLRELSKSEVLKTSPERQAMSETETISPTGQEIAQVRSTESGEAGRERSDNTGVTPSDVRLAGHGGGVSSEQSRAVYLKEHFAYIRDRINGNVLYPEMARKMGWCGQVKIAFIVCEDGGVDQVRVVDSSGFEVLDRNAVNTVKKVAPFPRPPVRAEIRMTVAYILN